ncbi:MAG: DUF4832 domain-containing protein [Planctomycetota bacterium]|nr:DUF4832 domain-containing protein [Planctomycetota bacterium]
MANGSTHIWPQYGPPIAAERSPMTQETARRGAWFASAAVLLLVAACLPAQESPADVTERLAAEITAALKNGEELKVWVNAPGAQSRVQVKDADSKALRVLIQGNPFPLAWSRMKPQEIAGIARDIAGGNAARLFLAGELALKLNLKSEASDLFTKAAQADPALAARIPREVLLPLATAGGNADSGGAAAEQTGKAAAPLPSGGKQITVAPEEDTATPLRLPDAGLQTRMWSAPRDNHVMRANILYARFTWKDWGLDGKGQVQHFKGWMAKKRYVAFRMYCNTPADLPDPGLPTATAGGTSVPRYWDPKFVEAHKRFLKALGQEMGNNPYLAYVDIGGVGNTGGEWLTYPDDRWGDKPVFRDLGYTPEAKEKLVWELCAAYREAFPHVRLYLAGAGVSFVKDRAALFAYMKQHNIGVRSDGLCWKSVGESDEWSVRKSGTHKIWQDVPFQWEGSYSTMEWEKEGWNTDKTMEKALEFGPISFCYADSDKDAVRFEGLADKVRILDRTALKLGYRIAVTSASYYDTVRSGASFAVQMTVANRGVSRVYADRELEVAIVDAQGRTLGAARARPVPGTNEWLPGKEVQATLQVRLPGGLPTGEWQLAIGMLDEDPRRPNQRLEMALKKHTELNQYILGPLRVR